MIYSESFIQHCERLYKNLYSLSGEKLVEDSLTGIALAEAIYHAPFVIVSHDTETDPIFNFANIKAQELWEMNWEEFTKTPSRLSAESNAQSGRQQFLDKTLLSGYISGYKGIRISKTGKKFYILDTIIWNIKDENNQYKGQAATFKQWKYL